MSNVRCIRVDDGTWERYRQSAEAEMLSVSAWIRKACERYAAGPHEKITPQKPFVTEMADRIVADGGKYLPFPKSKQVGK